MLSRYSELGGGGGGFFFFKQKTAYEMLRSLVGSEMCIRDSMSTGEEYFRALSKLSKEMATTDDYMKIGHLIVSTAVKTLKAKAAVVFMIDENSEDSISNTAIVQVGLSEKYIHAGPAHAVKISPQLLNCLLYTSPSPRDS